MFYFSEEAGRAFEDIGFRLSSLEFEIDPKRSYQFSVRIMQWRCNIEAVWSVFHNWFQGVQRGGLISITFLPQGPSGL